MRIVVALILVWLLIGANRGRAAPLLQRQG
jgi:hypothetical protein